MESNEIKKCCICGQEFIGQGCNPGGAAWLDEESGNPEFLIFNEDDVCCNECFDVYVVPGRVYRLGLYQKALQPYEEKEANQ